MVAPGDGMASRTTKIGPQTVAAMKQGDVVWDRDLRRFGARRRKDSVTYFVKARIDGRQRWINVGRHGPTTAAEARAKARQVLAEIDSGQDPTRERDGRRTIPIFSDFAQRWLREHVRPKRKPNTYTEYKRIIDLHIAPAIGKVRIDRLNRSDAVTLHADLAMTRYQANRVLAVLSAVMTFAERLGYRQPASNPCRGVERYKERKRKRALSIAEIATLWKHLDKLDDSINPYIVNAFRLLLLTGMRREEVLTLRWKHVDLDAGIIRLADAKSGPRDVVLSAKAIEVLRDTPRIEGNPYVLPGLKQGQRLVNITERWQEIRTALGFPEVRIHDLRHTVASLLARSAPITVVRDALGHAEISTTSQYSHASTDDVRNAVESLGKLLEDSR